MHMTGVTAKRSLLLVVFGFVMSVVGATLLFAHAHGQSTSVISVTTAPSPAHFTAARPNKTTGSILIENNSNAVVDVRASKAGSTCNSLANWAEYPWLDIRLNGLINPGDSATASITLDSRYLVPGEYSVLICLRNVRSGTDVPTGHFKTIPVNFTVEEGPGPEVEAVEIGQAHYDIGAQEAIRIPATALFDDGTRVSIGRYAQWSSADDSIATVTYGWAKGIAAGETELTATFGGKSTTTTVQVHDGPAKIAIEPQFINIELMAGKAAAQHVSINNLGGSRLDWNIAFAKNQSCDNTSTPAKPWLEISAEDETGSLAPGASTQSTFYVLGYNFYDETELLTPGTYQSAVCVTSNDPSTPIVSIPITLNVTPAPQIDVWSPDWQFYTLPGGNHWVYRFGDGDNLIEIRNAATAGTLDWEVFVAEGSCDTPATDSWLVIENPHGQSLPGQTEYAFFNPHGARNVNFAVGEYQLLMCVSSNDPVQPMIDIPLNLSVREAQDMPVRYIEVDSGSTDSIQIGETLQLQAIKYVLSGHDFAITNDATWSTSNHAVATVNQQGLITGHSAGTATITAKYENRSASVTISVEDIEHETPEEPAEPEPEQPTPPTIWDTIRSLLSRYLSRLLPWR